MHPRRSLAARLRTSLPDRRVLALCAVALLLVPMAALALRLSVELGPTSSEAPAARAGSYGELPPVFEPNRGQAPPDAAFVGRAEGLTLSAGRAGIGLSVGEDVAAMRFVGSSASVAMGAERPLPGRSHYLLGDDPDDWVRNVPHFERVRYAALWPGIDLVLHGSRAGALEYDLVIAPGADPSDIAFRYEGVSLPRIAGGALVVPLEHGEMRHEPPTLYQVIEGERVAVDGAFRLHDDGSVGFVVGAYDAAHALVIDPVVAYSTLIGGDQADFGRSIAVDAAGNAYVAGETNSPGYPTTAGAFDTSFNTNKDAFVTKLNATGTGILYSTFLGGTSEDSAFGIAVDAAGNAHVAGHTFSSGFPTTAGAHDTTRGGSSDAFVTKLAATGSTLLYSTYVGGSSDDAGRGIALDAAGNAYVTGTTQSGSTGAAADRFPPAGVAVSGYGGSGDAFLVRFNTTGALGYSTHLGGTSLDEGLAVAVLPGSTSIAYVTGFTSGGYDTTTGAFDTSYAGGRDAFVSKINTSAASAAAANMYGTYLGGTSDDQGNGIAVDAAGNAYVGGQTQGSGHPTTAGAFDTTHNGNSDAFYAKLSPTGSSLLIGSFLGGSGTDEARAIAIDDAGRATLVGRTSSSNFPTVGPLQTRQNGDDAFVTTFAASGAAVEFSTFLGGVNGDDIALGVTLDAALAIYVTGQTTSPDFPTTPGAYDRTHNGNVDVFVVKYRQLAADLAITKEDSEDPVLVDHAFQYDVNVTNLGPDNTTGVIVQDVLPDGIAVDGIVASQGSCSEDDGVITCALGALASGATARITIQVTPTGPGPLLNSANVTSGLGDPVPANNAANETTLVVASADLRVEKSDSPDPAVENGDLWYFVNVTNDGPTRAENVTLVDTLPAGVDFVSATSSEGSCSESAGVVTCELGTMADGATVEIEIEVGPTAPGVIVNVANVTSDDPDANLTNNEATETTTVEAEAADLSVTKEDARDPVLEGETIVYYVNVTNEGPGDAHNVTVQDALPEDTTFVSANATQGSCSHDAGVITCETGTMQPLDTVTIEIEVVADARGERTNEANATADEDDPDPSDDSANETTTVGALADLAIGKEDAPDPVMEGETLTYFLNVTNAGPHRADDVVVEDLLPLEVAFVGATSSQGSCSESGGVVTCELGALAANASAQIEVDVTPLVRGLITNVANVTSDDPDPDTSDNVAIEVTTVTSAPADIRVEKADSVDPVGVGQLVTYTIVVTNDGPRNATNVTLEDVAVGPADLESFNTTQGTCEDSTGLVGPVTVDCDLGDLASGSSAIVTVVVRTSADGTITNTATVAADEPDPDATNNVAIEGTTVVTPPAPEADVSVTKDDEADPVLVDETFTYEIVVANDGPDTAENVTLLDDVEDTFIVVSANATQGSCDITGNLVSCDLGDIDEGDDVTVTIAVVPTAPGTYNNTAVAGTSVVDPEPANNTDTEATTVEARPDEEQPPGPPSTIRCIARPDGNMISWSASPNATSYEVHRAVGGGEFELLATTSETSWLDEDVEAGTSYRYHVRAVNDAGTSDPSQTCDVLAIPFFTSALMVGLVTLAGVGIYAAARRRS